MCGEIKEKRNKNPMSCLPETFYNEAFCCSDLIKPQQKTHSGLGGIETSVDAAGEGEE